jgi:hypothetical protein
MAIPKDPDARKYFLAALQRLGECKIVLDRANLPAAAIYLSGYPIECMLKSMLLMRTPKRARRAMMGKLKSEFGHNLDKMRGKLVTMGVSFPKEISGAFAIVSTWSPELRYEPGPGNPRDAQRIVAAAEVIVQWVDRHT